VFYPSVTSKVWGGGNLEGLFRRLKGKFSGLKIDKMRCKRGEELNYSDTTRLQCCGKSYGREDKGNDVMKGPSGEEGKDGEFYLAPLTTFYLLQRKNWERAGKRTGAGL